MADPVVELQSGLVRGVVERHVEGFNYYAFKGIPYAQPPVGELRFKDPLPAKKWPGVLDCKNYGPMCLQMELFEKVVSYEEDCLYLNVFTRSINDDSVNNPVIVIIHGGAYYFGSSSDRIYGPDYLIRKNIVLVSMNYRLGILGFLNLENEIAAGNQGLKDQVLALEWIQQNIRRFGGNPGNVTVFGVGCGGSSAQFLAMSPLTKGLMHKIISSSTVAQTLWNYEKNPRSIAVEFCSLLGKQLHDPREIFEFLRAAEPKILQECQEQLRLKLSSIPFKPGPDVHSSNPFMPPDVDEAMEQGVHLPCLVGYCAREGSLLLSDIFHPGSLSEYLSACNQDIRRIFIYGIDKVMNRHDLTEMQVKRLYFKADEISDDSVDNYVDFAGDFYFFEAVHRFARVQTEKSSAPTYMYVFSYDSQRSVVKILLKNVPKGASHFDDLSHVFKMGALDDLGLGHFEKGTWEHRIMEQMTEMWANFAKYGRPTIETSELIPVHWQPLSNGTVLRYLDIDEDLTMRYTVNVDQKLASAKDVDL